MPLLAIVAYPCLTEADRQWIESIRARHDPQASRISAHFTLVFPVEVSPIDVLRNVSVVAKSTQPIQFVIRDARAVRDALGGGSHVFLVPDKGRVEITKLHDRLYEGVLRAHLRTDFPFMPHITVAAAPPLDSGKRLAQALKSP